MPVYISIIRGINVSGQKMIRMDALKELYASLKFSDIRTYIQSGNVIFSSNAMARAELEKRIGKKIAETFGFDVPVMVLGTADIRTVLENNPFVTRRKEDPSLLHVTFLAHEPSEANIEAVLQAQSGDDECVVSGRTVYLYCPNGYGRTKLNNTFFEKKFQTIATTRNWKTVNELYRISME